MSASTPAVVTNMYMRNSFNYIALSSTQSCDAGKYKKTKLAKMCESERVESDKTSIYSLVKSMFTYSKRNMDFIQHPANLMYIMDVMKKHNLLYMLIVQNFQTIVNMYIAHSVSCKSTQSR